MNGKNLLILGAGQYGQVARETAEAMGIFREVAFLDDNSPAALGRLDQYAGYRGTFSCAFVAMGNPDIRMKWLERLEDAGFELPVLIHPMAWVSPSARLGGGSIVEPMAVVHTGAEVGTGGLLCAGCVVNHNARVGDCCQIDCGAVVASNADVSAGTKVPCGEVAR